MILFNEDMDQRLTDLHAAAVAGVGMRITRHGEFQHMPERVAVDTAEGRSLVFSLPMAGMVADQMEANGFPDLAAELRAAAQ
jgi:hypothetical protein